LFEFSYRIPNEYQDFGEGFKSIQYALGISEGCTDVCV
jgi:hypothetical protein